MNPFLPRCNMSRNLTLPGFNPCVPQFNPCVPRLNFQQFNPILPKCNPCLAMQVPLLMALKSIWHEESLPTFKEKCLFGFECPTDGKIYVMYHGTTYKAAKKIIKHGFQQSQTGMLGRGVYVSRDINKAVHYPQNVFSKKVVLKLRVNVGKVKRINYQNHPMQVTWQDHGYDTAWVPPNCGMVPSGLEEDCIWDPRRIKVVEVVGGAPEHIAKLNRLIYKSKQ